MEKFIEDLFWWRKGIIKRCCKSNSSDST